MKPRRKELHFGRLITCYAGRPATVQAMLAPHFADAATSVAVVEAERRVTYGELGAMSASLAAALHARGVAKGHRVAVMLGNGIDAALSVLALIRLEAILVPLGVRLKRPEIGYIFQDATPTAVIVAPEFAPEVEGADAMPALCIETARPAWQALLAAPASLLPPYAAAEADVAAILYTSGTTGQPKGAMLTHLNIVHSCLHWQNVHALAPADRTLFCIPWSHVAGLCGVLLPFLNAGATLIMMAEFKRRDFLTLAQRERMTHALLVPAMYGLLLLEPDLAAFDLRAWRLGAYGSAPMPQPTRERFARALPHLRLCNCYGATETCSPATIMPPAQSSDRPASVGRVVPCGDIVVMTEAGHEAAPGEDGEIWIGGPMVTPGYWRRAEADSQAFAGGFWKSGDVGTIDAEGFVHIVDRKKDMINRGGFKIYPAEVENTLAALPGVVESAVVGRPDPMLGEAVVAFLCVSGGELVADDVRRWCAARMADYKVPAQIVITQSPLPRNPNGKIQKAALRASLANEYQAATRAP